MNTSSLRNNLGLCALRAAAAEVSVHCARKWVARYRAEGELGLLDRSSAPSTVANRTPEDRIQAIAALRRLRFTGPEIAELLGMALSTVSDILTRTGWASSAAWGSSPPAATSASSPGRKVGSIDTKNPSSRRAGLPWTGSKDAPHEQRRPASGLAVSLFAETPEAAPVGL